MKVYVERNEYEYEQMFAERGYAVVETPFEADLVCFTGGADVSPELYGDVNYASSTNTTRDLECIYLYNLSSQLDIPCVGICRGGQFLNVMNGGKMDQHITQHGTGSHELTTHKGERILVSSTHHQAIKPLEGEAELVVWDDSGQVGEVVVYGRGSECDLCFQPHPEYGGFDECTDYFFDLIEEFIQDED